MTISPCGGSCFVPGKGEPGTQPALPPTQPPLELLACVTGAPRHPPPPPPPPPLPPRRCHSCSHLAAARSCRAGLIPLPQNYPGTSLFPKLCSSPFPQIVRAAFPAWAEPGALLHPAQLTPYVYFCVCTHPLPFLPPLPGWFSATSFFFSSLLPSVSLAVSLPSCLLRANIAQPLIPICCSQNSGSCRAVLARTDGLLLQALTPPEDGAPLKCPFGAAAPPG